MSDHDRPAHDPGPAGSFWTSRAGIVLIGFLAVAGLLLAYEHRLHVFTGYGFLVVLVVLCAGMHLFMHGGHGGHGGNGAKHKDSDPRDRP